MTKESLKLSLTFLGAIIFNLIFWNEKIGVNALLFDVFIMCCIYYLYPSSVRNKICIGLGVAHLITAAMVVVHNTALSKIGFSITLLLFVSFSQYIHRSAWYAGGSSILNYILAIPNFFRQLKSVKPKNINLARLSRPARMLLIPFIIVTIFIVIYAFGNAVFSNIASDIFTAVQHWFANIFYWLSIPRFTFFLLGILITNGLIIKTSHFELHVELC